MRRLEQAGSRRGKTEKSLGTDEKALETSQKVLRTNRKVFGDKADYRQRIEVVLRAPEQLKRGKDHVRRHERQTEEDGGEGIDERPVEYWKQFPVVVTGNRQGENRLTSPASPGAWRRSHRPSGGRRRPRDGRR